MMTDYRTPQALEVTVGGAVVFRWELAGSSDFMEMSLDQHYARIYARILNPDLPVDAAAEFTWISRYGRVSLDGTIPALHPNFEYMIPETLERFGAREWEKAA
jgi:hypothetical protein